jgi:hypothetical protein
VTDRGGPGGSWPPKGITRRIREAKKRAAAIPRRYSDKLLVLLR